MTEEVRQLRLRALVLGVTAALVAGVLLVGGIGRVAGYAHINDALRGADYRWLASCAAGQLAVFLGYAGALRRAIAAGGGIEIPRALAVRLALAGFAATQVFAFGGLAGLALTWWALRQTGMTREEAAVRLIGLNTAVYFVFGLLGLAAAAIALPLDEAPMWATVPWLITIPIVIAAAAWFTDSQRVDRWTAPAPAGLLRRGLAVGVGAAAWTRRQTRLDPRLFAWAMCYWVGDLVSLWGALRAFGARPSPVALAVAYATGYLVNSLPIPLIATGGVDAATTFMLRALGVPLDLALLGVVAHRVFAFWLPVIPGAFFAFTLPRLGRDLERATTAIP